mgnify:CR=1 FL=1
MVAIIIDRLLLVDLLENFRMVGNKIEIPIIKAIANKCSNPKILNFSASNI